MSNSAWLITSRLYASLAFFQLRQLHLIRSYLTMDSAKTLVHAFISVRLDYCNSLLVGAADCIIQKLQAVQNAAAQLINGTRKFDHITPILRELHLLPVHLRIQYKIAMLDNKCLRGLAPPYLAELCQPVVELVGRRHLRSAASGKLSVQRTATNIGRRNFAISGPDMWNSLPTDLRLSSLSTATFARHLKTHLFRSTECHYACSASEFFKAALFISDFIDIDIDININIIIIIFFLNPR